MKGYMKSRPTTDPLGEWNPCTPVCFAILLAIISILVDLRLFKDKDFKDIVFKRKKKQIIKNSSPMFSFTNSDVQEDPRPLWGRKPRVSKGWIPKRIIAIPRIRQPRIPLRIPNPRFPLPRIPKPRIPLPRIPKPRIPLPRIPKPRFPWGKRK